MDSKELFEVNKKAVFAVMEEVMKRLGASRLAVTGVYSGSGDEGGVEDVTVEAWKDDQRIELGLEHFPSVEETFVQSDFDPGRKAWVEHAPETRTVSIQVAVERLTEDAIDIAGHRGYEINDGGHGEFTLSVSAGEEPTAYLKHHDYYVDETASEHTL